MLGYITAGIGFAAAASLAGMHTMVPWSQLYGANFNGLPRGTKKLALTYDDGPNDPYTGRLLEVLAKHDVHATFFLVGKWVEQRPSIARTVAEAGHALGNHTYSHPNLIFVSNAELRRQITRTQNLIVDATGVTPKLFRPPFGGRRPGTFSVAREFGFTPVMWRVSSYDWEATSPAQVEDRVSRGVRGGDVILLHDGGHLALGTDRSHTIAATDALIRRYKDEGYQFATVPDMLVDSKQV